MKVATQDLDLNEQITIAREQLIRARIFLDIWWFQYGSPTRQQTYTATSKYSEFFNFDEHAHLTSFIVHISTLFDSRRDAVSLEKIMKKAVPPSLQLSDLVRKEIAQHLKTLKPLAEKLLILRHNNFAHRSNSMSYKSAFEEAKVSYEIFLVVTDSSKAVLDLLLKATGRGTVEFRPYPREHLAQMLAELTPKDA